MAICSRSARLWIQRGQSTSTRLASAAGTDRRASSTLGTDRPVAMTSAAADPTIAVPEASLNSERLCARLT